RNFAAGRQGFAGRRERWRRSDALQQIGTLLAEEPAKQMETTMSEGLFGIHGAALEVRAQRLGVLSSNIANAATPGYKARDIDFAAALEARLGGTEAEAAAGRASEYRIPVMPSLDGNTVALAVE